MVSFFSRSLALNDIVCFSIPVLHFSDFVDNVMIQTRYIVLSYFFITSQSKKNESNSFISSVPDAPVRFFNESMKSFVETINQDFFIFSLTSILDYKKMERKH